MRSPQPEVDQRFAAGGEHLTGGFGGDDGLEMHEVYQPGLDELRLWKRRNHPQNRLVRKEHGPFRQGVDIASEPQPRQIFEQLFGKGAEPAQLSDVLCREGQVFKIAESLIEPCRHQEAAARRQFAHEQLENSGIRQAIIQIRR